MFRNWIPFDYQKAVCYQKKKHFSFTDSARYSFYSRSFHNEAQKAFDFNVVLSQGHICLKMKFCQNCDQLFKLSRLLFVLLVDTSAVSVVT